ncbi:MAG: TPM domain-containing protein [Bacteroidetes bacterium]|nr:TPM domain-containing protein [Bacteroidota bacterium]
MKYHAGKFGLILGLLCSSMLCAQERKPVRDYVGLVNDFAGVLSAGDRQLLETKLRKYEDSTSTQIVVVTEKSLNGRDQFDRSMDFTRGWGIGGKKNNNGVLLYVALDERKISIRASDATTGTLIDSKSGEIIRNVIAPHMRTGAYYQAFDAGTTAIIQVLGGEFKAGGKPKPKMPTGLIVMIIIIVIFIIIFNNRGPNRGFRNTGAYWWGGGGFGGGSWGGGGSSGGSSWGGMGGGGGWSGGGADGGW